MFCSIKITNFILFCYLILLVSSDEQSNNEIQNNDEVEENNISTTTTPTAKRKYECHNENFLLIFNAGTVLLPFSIYDVVFPIWEHKPGKFVDDYRFEYEPFKNITYVLKKLRRKKFKLYAILNVFFSNEMDPLTYSNERETLKLCRLPRKEQVEEVFRIFGWSKVFHKIVYYQIKIGDMMVRFRNETGIPFKNMLYFDNNEKYDDKVVRMYNMFRYVIRNGITVRTIQSAFLKYSKIPGNNEISFII